MTINDEDLMFKWNKTKDTQISSNLNSFYINFEGVVLISTNVKTCREQEEGDYGDFSLGNLLCNSETLPRHC